MSAAGPMPVRARPTGPTDAAPAARAHGHGGPGDWPGPLADRDNRHGEMARPGPGRRPALVARRRRSESQWSLGLALPSVARDSRVTGRLPGRDDRPSPQYHDA